MEILRVFNNNVVLAKDGDGEVILTGRGLGFQAKPGQTVDPAKVVRRFVPTDGRDPDHLAQMVADVPPEMIRMIGEAMRDAGLPESEIDSPTLVLALSDHINGAIQRLAKGIEVTYPLVGEISNLYPQEYERGRALLAAINRRLGAPTLPKGEETALAMHLVNAGFATGDLSYTYTMTGVIQQMIDIIESAYGVKLDQGSVNVGRFITHLRYLFVRIHQHRQLADEPEPVVNAIRGSYPDALKCARTIAAVLELRLDADITDDEIAYLALHVARVAKNAQEDAAAQESAA
ncbi:PRD domain-containing protein [Bifidobacterium vespertilionis]|uniref:PRD domain-containing protein n=1 Tax=Bifidobacterium vespertilionis TaxID=2562524 RepID=A0A5J5DX53_9BIFI|nr:PRD domain-containing protein [Bifidobacterium vespertilionis]KAA8821302.1 PRD domain-containing protein [Bifidobacterium vespertilionis]KAA8821485.1 PRD domain-containing protein [Bifidobacterium vespertilionis]